MFEENLSLQLRSTLPYYALIFLKQVIAEQNSTLIHVSRLLAICICTQTNKYGFDMHGQFNLIYCVTFSYTYMYNIPVYMCMFMPLLYMTFQTFIQTYCVQINTSCLCPFL